jgi:hypothetical protein
MMGAMSSDEQAAGTHPVTAPAAVPEVVEWGSPDAHEPQRPARPQQQWLPAVPADRRLVPLTAALGGVGLFASLISEWQVTAIDGTAFGAGEVGARPVAVGIADLGAWGGGYLVGLFVLVAAAVLMVFGPPAGRVYGRLVVLSTAGVLLALLAGLLSELGTNTRALSYATVLSLEADQLTMQYGRGGYCAVAGVLAVLLAAVLAGRRVPAPAAPTPVPADGQPVAATTTPDAPAADWSWRRPRDDDEDDRSPDEPYELTVSGTEPFTPLADSHDTYRRPDPISG